MFVSNRFASGRGPIRKIGSIRRQLVYGRRYNLFYDAASLCVITGICIRYLYQVSVSGICIRCTTVLSSQAEHPQRWNCPTAMQSVDDFIRPSSSSTILKSTGVDRLIRCGFVFCSKQVRLRRADLAAEAAAAGCWSWRPGSVPSSSSPALYRLNIICQLYRKMKSALIL